MMRAVSFITLCLSAAAVVGQELPDEEKDINLQQFTDDLVGYPDEDASYDDQYENLLQTLSSPYDLNRVSEEELKSLHLLTDLQIENFRAYRKEQGTLLDVYELQVISGFDLTLIDRLLPFIKVTDPAAKINQSLIKRIFSPGHSYVVTRFARTLEMEKGFMSNAGTARLFSGSPDKLYLRARSAQSGDYSLGVTGEKDAGERFSWNRNDHTWGFDFASFHLQLQNKGKLKNLIAGDFQTQFAQGLILGGAFGLGKGGESVSTTRKSHLGFLPYTSINESAYLRGVAFTLQALPNIRVSAFYSRARRDASSSAEADTPAVAAFQKSGLHRSQAEIANRKKVTEQNYGLVVHFEKTGMDGGLILNAIHFNLPVRRNPTLYNQLAFTGSTHLNTGVFLNYRAGNISFFSEAARSVSGGSAILAGLLMALDPRLDLSILWRNYTPHFHPFYSNAFSESTQPQNERGIYWGWKYRWNRNYSFYGYVDLFTFPWLGFRRYAPSSGSEWLLRANYQPSKKASVFIQVREEIKSRNLPEPGALYRLADGKKRNLALNCDYGIGEKVRLKTRVQYNSYLFNSKTTEGVALAQDITFSLGRLKFTGRHALFDAEHYDNRHYVYENDAWLAYSLPAYSGVGVRNFALLEYKVHKQLTIWVRYARTQLLNSDEIGSGGQAVVGNTKNDVKFQARFKF